MQNTLNPGDILRPSDAAGLTSPNGAFILTLQKDGDLVTSLAGEYPVWSSHTRGMAVDRLIYQTDGNVAMYAVNDTLLFETGTSKIGAGGELVLDDHGTLLVLDAQGATVWSSGSVAVLLEVQGPLTDFQYDTASAVTTFPKQLQTVSKTLTNTANQPQQMFVEFDVAYSETTLVSSLGAVLPGFAADATTGLPTLSAGRVTIGPVMNSTFILGLPVIEMITKSTKVPVKVEARSSVDVVVTVTQQSVTVPFTCSANQLFLVAGSKVELDVIRLRTQGTISSTKGFSAATSISRPVRLGAGAVPAQAA